MRVLCCAWLVPAVSSVWIGFAAVGLRDVPAPDLARALGRTQAVVVLLAIFTALTGGIWALRTWPSLRARPRASGDSRWRTWRAPASHGAALLASGGAIAVARSVPTGTSAMFAAAALLACYGGLAPARWLLRSPLANPFPLAALSAGITFQLTVGWLHALAPDGPLSAALVIEGLALAWMATSAARAAPLVGRPVEAGRVPGEVSQAPARPSLPEPAVGR